MKPVVDVIEAYLARPEAAPLLHAPLGGSPTLAALLPLVTQLAAVLSTARVSPATPAAGRHLAHLDPAGRFNLQWDLFTPNYTGGIHAHGTWGCFFVLRGTLYSEDFAELAPGGPFELLRGGAHTPGSAAAFAPPQDWHRVRTGEGPQLVSLHAYGPGFDLDRGVALDAQGRPAQYTRGPLRDLAALEGLVSWP